MRCYLTQVAYVEVFRYLPVWKHLKFYVRWWQFGRVIVLMHYIKSYSIWQMGEEFTAHICLILEIMGVKENHRGVTSRSLAFTATLYMWMRDYYYYLTALCVNWDSLMQVLGWSFRSYKVQYSSSLSQILCPIVCSSFQARAVFMLLKINNGL